MNLGHVEGVELIFRLLSDIDYRGANCDIPVHGMYYRTRNIINILSSIWSSFL